MNPEAFAKKGLHEITTDQQRGASQLARRCLQLIADYARQLQPPSPENKESFAAAITKFTSELQSSRPSMAPVENLLQRFAESLENLPANAQAVDYIEQQTRQLIEQSKQAVFEAAKNACKLIKPGDTVFTHSFSSTVAETFAQLAQRPVKAIITESRPGNEGEMLARQLSGLNIPTEYITEAQIGLFIDRCDIVLVGADGLLADGSVVNKSGTYLLALSAFENKIPFYVCCESYKKTLKKPSDIILEEKSSDELSLSPLPLIRPRNIYFDITPSKWISGYISEHGIQNR